MAKLRVVVAGASGRMGRTLVDVVLRDPALELAVALNWVFRQLCDRQFVEEKLYAIQVLIDSLANMRDMFYVYQDRIPAETLRTLSWYDLPELRPDRNRLHIPEGDRIVSEALLDEVFQGTDPDPEAFAEAFAEIQSADRKSTRLNSSHSSVSRMPSSA